MKLLNVPFRVESTLMRAYFRWTGARPDSRPYLSGDGFRSLADWRFERENAATFDPSMIRPGSLGFCDGWLLGDFLIKVAPRVPHDFRLISHNADPNFDALASAQLPDRVTLFTVNRVVDDPRSVAIPIGLENACLHYNGVIRDFDRLRRRETVKRHRVLVAFTVGTNQKVRGPALDALSRLPVVDLLARINSRSYRKIARKYAFVASPPGNGEDCHRTWEALYLGAVPIVIRSAMTEAFVARGLPLWQVESYEELVGLDECDLAARYEKFAGAMDSPWLWMDRWASMVRGLP